MENKLGETIKTLRKKAQLSQQELGDAVGVSKGSISRYESGSMYPEVEKLTAIAGQLGVSVAQLFNYEPSNLDGVIRPLVVLEDGEEHPDFIQFRRFEIAASAGNGHSNYEVAEKSPLSLNKDYVNHVLEASPSSSYMIYVRGDSMTNEAHAGHMPDKTMILFDRAQTKVISGKYYVVRIGDELLVKQLFQDQFTVTLHSINPDWVNKDIILQKNENWQDIEILGRVVYKQFGRAL